MRGPRPAQGGGQTTGAQKRTRLNGPKRKRHYAALKEATNQPAKTRKPQRPLIGMAAALSEHKDFKAAGMLEQWRERWRHVLTHRND